MLLAGMVGAAFAAAYVSAAVGIAGGTLFIVLLYLMLPPQLALPLHGAVQVVNNGARSWVFRSHVVWPIARAFMLPVLPAMALGWYLLGLLDMDWLKGLLGVYVLFAVIRPPASEAEPSAGGWSAIGGGASLSSMLVGAADPVIAPFFISERYTRQQVIATKAVCQLSTHVPKVFLFAWLGQQTFDFSYAEYGVELAAMMGAVLLGIVCGKRTDMPDRWFRRAYRLLLAVLALRLVFEFVSVWLVS
ncbi:MAG: sulfite exporter TauE/SafE family protein [Myxococcota bacterium]|nr:sulfite exporter TauE/SafE family protein [Myxococcota bacterium]